MDQPTSKIYYNLGILYEKTQCSDESLVAFDTAIRLDPYCSIAQFQAGILTFEMGRLYESAAYFKSAYQVWHYHRLFDLLLLCHVIVFHSFLSFSFSLSLFL